MCKIYKNILKFNNKDVKFDSNIKQVLKYENILIVLTSSKESLNVYGVDLEGNVIWTINTTDNSTNIYNKIVVEEGNLVLYDSSYFKFVINEETGEFIKEKIRPLDSINKKGDFLFTKNNLYQLLSLLFIFFIIINSLSSCLKPSKKDEENNVENVTRNLQTIKTIDVIDEEVPEIISKDIHSEEIEESEESVTTIPEASETSKKINEKIENDSSILPDVLDSSIKDSISEKYPNSKYPGVDLVIDTFEDVVDTVTSGKSVSINNSQDYITASFSKVISGNEIEVIIEDKTKILKLISVKENDDTKYYLSEILKNIDILYIEQDIKKTSGDLILGYVWTDKPDLENKENMINYLLLSNDLAIFEIQSPNIKYNRFFN